ncbi:M24 family metallopeptidase [Pendulispora rubella]
MTMHTRLSTRGETRPHSYSDRLAKWLSGRSTASARPPSAADVEGFRNAQRLAFECAQATAKEMRPGWTEGRTSRWMMRWMNDHEVRAHLHKPIVAFAERTLAPTQHWEPARGEGEVLREGDVVILDCSPIVDGYTGDIAYTLSVGPNPTLEKAQSFLSELRARLPQRFANPETARDVFHWADAEIRAAGYDNAADGYVHSVMGHRVYRHGKYFSRETWFPSERAFGFMISWHGPGFLLKSISRLVYPETLGPLHHGPKTGVWAIEPHVRVGTFGCKFEELLIVDEGRAYWLDDVSQKRITIAA